MSDEHNDGFKPIDLGTLENFQEEVSGKTPETEPDFNRFKLLFNPPEPDMEKEGFKILYTVQENEKEEVFEPLIEGADTQGHQTRKPDDGSPEDQGEESSAPPVSPEADGFDKGFKEGLAKGQAQGMAEGEARGFEEGLAKGEAEGVKKGEAEGLTKGEKNGFEKGVCLGEEKGREEILAQAEEILAPLKESLETADRLLDQLLARYEGQIIELVYKISEKVVLAKLDSDDEIVKHTIIDAMKNLVVPEEIELIVSTEDYEYVEMAKDAFFESVKTLKHIAVASDPMIPKGGCRIESAGATVTTDPESKLRAVYDAVAGVRR